MARIEKTVFISYRRADRWQALAVFKDLTQHGYDAFIDYAGLSYGDFEHAIFDNIRARAHFILLLTPTALERCDDPADWLRREIEVALQAQRNIVPLLLDGFSFSTPLAEQRLQGPLAALRRYQAHDVPTATEYFDRAMELLRTRYLAKPVEAVIHLPSAHAQQIAQEQQAAALGDAGLQAAAVINEVDQPGPTAPVLEAAPAPKALALPVAAPSPETAALRAAKQFSQAEAAPEGVLAAPPTAALAEPLTKEHAQARGSSPTKLGPLQVLAAVGSLGAVVFGAVALTGGKKPELPSAASSSSGALPASAASASPESPTDPAKQYELGEDFLMGRSGRAQDDVKAVNWFRAAANQNHAPAQSALGFMFEFGRGGLPQDDAHAVSWFRKAAEQGDLGGQFSLGLQYETGGSGLPKDHAQAVNWYRRVAERGAVGVAFKIGLMYETSGDGLPKDRAKAVSWYRVAAKQGDAKGQSKLGYMYEYGLGGLPEDAEQAASWYRAAAEQGDQSAPAALKRLGKK